jgi:hypothetical protein
MCFLKENYYDNPDLTLNTVNAVFIPEHGGLILQSLLPKIRTQLGGILQKSTIAERVK